LGCRGERGGGGSVKQQKLIGNEKLRAVYANAASALTVQFNDLKAKSKKPP